MVVPESCVDALEKSIASGRLPEVEILQKLSSDAEYLLSPGLVNKHAQLLSRCFQLLKRSKTPSLAHSTLIKLCTMFAVRPQPPTGEPDPSGVPPTTSIFTLFLPEVNAAFQTVKEYIEQLLDQSNDKNRSSSKERADIGSDLRQALQVRGNCVEFFHRCVDANLFVISRDVGSLFIFFGTLFRTSKQLLPFLANLKTLPGSEVHISLSFFVLSSFHSHHLVSSICLEMPPTHTSKQVQTAIERAKEHDNMASAALVFYLDAVVRSEHPIPVDVPRHLFDLGVLAADILNFGLMNSAWKNLVADTPHLHHNRFFSDSLVYTHIILVQHRSRKYWGRNRKTQNWCLT